MSEVTKDTDVTREIDTSEMTTEMTTVEMPPLPEEMINILEGVNQEWEIFQTRLASLQRAVENGAPASIQKRSMVGAKQAAMCVRNVLREFGRIAL